MPKILSPKSPVQADHRFIRTMVDSICDDKIIHDPKEYNNISSTFSKLGGSWESVFKGSIDGILLLKKVIKFAFKNGYLTKKPSWTVDEKRPEK